MSTHSSSSSWLSSRSVRKIQEKSNHEFVSIKNMYEALLKKEAQLKEDIDSLLEEDTISKNRKMHLLLKNWHDNTYIPLNAQISKEMASMKYAHLEQEKRKQFMKYLKHCNNKGHIFLDTFDRNEYNPMHLNQVRPGPIKAATEKLKDPLVLLRNQRNEEKRISHSCSSGKLLSDKGVEDLSLPSLPLVPLGRHGTDCDTWLGMKFVDIQSEVRARSQQRMLSRRNLVTNNWFDNEEIGSTSTENLFSRKWCKRRQFANKHDVVIQLV